jgi:uncharacterized SAM-binding protein YcdF (DUF218 family)
MIYRFIVTLLQPYPLLYLLTLVALLRLWRKRPAERRLVLFVLVPLLLLGIVSLPAVGHFAVGTLEWRYPPQSAAAGDAGVIVVLSGYVRPPSETVPEAELGSDTFLRCLHAARLYKAKPRPILVSGGPNGPTGPTLARSMRDFLAGQGVKEEDLLMEEESGTTYENALHSGEILSRRNFNRIVLVTSAFHMPRSERCFRALGFQVVASPCDYHSVRSSWTPCDFLLPSPHAAAGVEMAVHEWLGIAWYWLRGRI